MGDSLGLCGEDVVAVVGWGIAGEREYPVLE